MTSMKIVLTREAIYVSTSLEETNRNLRLVILGLDGLDPHLVDRWEMDWFKQKVWGRHYVGFLKKLYTPIVWGCFLTGLNVGRLKKPMQGVFKTLLLLYSVRVD